jgi:hypothetical protein
MSDTPFACNIGALSSSERSHHRELTTRLAASVRHRTEVSDGYAFVLDEQRMPVADLAAWADLERRCCPFFDFALELRREHGPLTLRLTGRDGVKPFIQAEFSSHFR